MKNKNLITIRNENNMLQREVAELLGISGQGYHLKESGKYDFTQTEMIRLSEIFGKSLDELFGQERKVVSLV